MDTSPLQSPIPQQPLPQSPHTSPLAAVKLVFAIILVTITVPILIFSILNYFNVLSLSKLYPETFGFLPYIGKIQVIPVPTPVPLVEQIFPCPVQIDPCPPGEYIPISVDDPGFQGLGFQNIAKDIAVLSAFNGTYAVFATTSAGPRKLPRVRATIRSTDEKFQAAYLFQGAPVEKAVTGGTVSRGEVIGILGGEAIGINVYYKRYNLIFSLQDSQTEQYLKLEPSDDKKGFQMSE